MNYRKTLGALLIAGGLGIAAIPAAQATPGADHREVVCHQEGNGSYHAVPPDNASAHIPKHEGDFLLAVTYIPSRDGKWNDVKDRFNDLCNGGTPTVTTVTPGPTQTITVTGSPTTVTETVTPTETTTETGPVVTVTETVTPTETTTITGEPVTVTETVTPTETVKVTGPAVTVTEDVPGPTVTESNVLPETTVTKTVSGDVVTTFVDRDSRRVVAVERTPTELAYTGVNMLYLAGGLILVLLGVIALMGRKISVLRS